MDHTTPPAERLAAAVKQLRTAATAATPSADPYPGGWAGFGPEADAYGRSMLFGGPADGDEWAGTVVKVNEDCDGGCVPMSDADTRYVALMHPAVGLAIADWLDVALRSVHFMQGLDGSWPPFTGAAIAVADQILGIPAARALAESRNGVVAEVVSRA